MFFTYHTHSHRHQRCTTLLIVDVLRGLQKIRSLGVPKAPINIAEIRSAINRVEIFETYCRTMHTEIRELFLDHLYEGKDFSYCIFSSKKIMQLIEEKIVVRDRHYFIDGTFKVVPLGCFTQLLVFHVAKFDTVHPFIFVLMSNRTQQAYTHLFKYIHKHIFSLSCASFYADFEKAISNALQMCFIGCIIVHCWFHHVQAIRRKVSKLPDLFQLVRTNVAACKIYFKFQALALLHPDMIPAAFKGLADDALNCSELFKPFVEYYDRQWMQKVGDFFM